MGKTTATNPRSSRELMVAYLRMQIDELRTREPGARIERPDAAHRIASWPNDIPARTTISSWY